MKAAVLGATGYTGQVLLRILGEHPEVREIIAVSSSQAGARITAVDPGLDAGIEGKVAGGLLASAADAVRAAEAGGLDVVFSALPHLKSAEVCAPFFARTVVIDLSADFRLHDPAVFQAAYGSPLPKPDLLPRAVYGLAEWHTEAIRKADIIACPGCYPTATLLPLLPLAREGLLKGAVIVNAISGISGAGRKEKADLLFCERSENANAYAPGTSHRHAPEIAQELGAAHGSLQLLFTPHMAPLRRGMAVTTVAELAREPSESGPRSVEGMLRACYGGRQFISLTGSRVPQTREVWGSNRCDIGWRREGRHLMLFSVIDNLVKGASGQAVQNMNIRFGIPETVGLHTAGEM
ncbi:MAG: N-acetyl-gamma-glutamyl-phosphate reductase [Spirochaetia bacterium]|jgi:N-acetyl-gamma-glutamyl-phosphate reductase